MSCVRSTTVPTLSLLTIHRPGRSPSLERIGKKRQIRSAAGVGILRGLHRRRQRAVAGAATLALIFEQTQLAEIVPKVHYVDD